MKISKLKRGDLVRVVWFDSYSSARWYNDKEAQFWQKGLTLCTSVGFFFGTTKYSMTIYSDVSQTEIGGMINIPKKVVRKINLLKKIK
ncbi:MAG: hypothetical protein ACXACU_17095 [Candidatus Hodarchaeales archaeon]|jgi:hypothetical protein